MKPVIETHDLCKSYNGRTVVDHLNLTVPQGCVYGFLGPNGAGKSTSMKMLLGLVHPTGGSVELLGHTMNETNRIPLLRQTGSLIESPSGYLHLTARENLAIVADLKGVAHKDISRVLEIVHLTADANRKVGQYSLGMKQRLGIAMALLGSPKLLILDEPTASLTPQEIEGLMEIIENLTADGKSVILITHKLKEITASSDNCTIIRQGKYIQTVKVADVNENELAAMMVGRDVNFKVDKKKMEPGEVVLEVKDLHAKDYRGVEILKGFNLNVRKGEIVGLAGVDGNGQTELVEVLTGLRKAESGTVTMLGKDVFNKSPKETFENGISSIPADRQKHGLILDFSNEDNMILQHFEEEPFSSHGFLNRKAIREHAEELIEKFDVRPRGCAEAPAGTLSGGNQQKVIIAKWLMMYPKVLILDEPTRGIDVGAKALVLDALKKFNRENGVTVVMISSELEELRTTCDRIAIVSGGRIVGILPATESSETFGALMVSQVK